MNAVTLPKHKAKKYLGQNFILDPSIAESIVSFAGCIKGYDVIEVGPGLGTMTQAIIKSGVNKLIAIEKDKSLSAVHSELEKVYPNYQCIYQDVLNTDIPNLGLKTPIKMIANLPYNISVILLLKLLDSIHMFEGLTLMFQKEVANRIVAAPGTKGYSTLSVLVQLLCDVEKVADFPPEVFSPSPKVHSSVVNIVPLKTPRAIVDYQYLCSVLKMLFHCKRKTIINVLKSRLKDSVAILEACGIDSDTRAETLSIEKLCILSNYLQARSITP